MRGSRTVDQLPGVVTVASVPLIRDGRLSGAVLARAEQPEEIERTIDALRGDRLTAGAIAVAVAVVIGFLIATAITTRVKRLAGSAARITEGRLDEPLEGTGGRDEITELGMALETMRIALRETFGALSSERDRLSAIFDALDDAVMVVGRSGGGAILESGRRAPDWARRKGDRGARPLAAPRRRARHRRARRPAGRRSGLRGRDSGSAGRGRRAGGGARSHRRAPPRARGARVRVQRRPRAAQPDRRHLGCDRGPARRRQG